MYIYNNANYYIQNIYEDKTIDLDTNIVKIFFSNNLFSLDINEQIKLYQKFNITRIINLQNEYFSINIDSLKLFHCPLINIFNLNINDINILTNQLITYPSLNILKKDISNSYANFILDTKNIKQLKNIIEILKNEIDGNTLIMSKYGIHHTGIIISLLLEMFNLPRELIINTYFQSNHFYHQNVNILMKELTQNGLSLDNILKLPYLLGADLDYIKALFNTIDNKYQTIEKYCLKRLKISKDDIDYLKDLYL